MWDARGVGYRRTPGFAAAREPTPLLGTNQGRRSERTGRIGPLAPPHRRDDPVEVMSAGRGDARGVGNASSQEQQHSEKSSFAFVRFALSLLTSARLRP